MPQGHSPGHCLFGGYLRVIFILAFLTPGCLDFGGGDTESSPADGPITAGVYTFAAESKEEQVFATQ